MLEQYATVSRKGSAEIVVRRSRFIGHAAPVQSEEEAVRFVDEIRKKHALATHNCYAYVVGDRDQWQKQSDDGEPAGTAGKPILEVIRQRRLKNTAVVVTRYFGGVMLGAGGLVRAYTDGAVAGIDASGQIVRKLHRELIIEAGYAWLGKIEHELRRAGIPIKDTQFAENVVVTALPLHGETDRAAALLTEATQGKCPIALGESVWMNHPPE